MPRCNSSFGQRSFSCCASKIWNDIWTYHFRSELLVFYWNYVCIS